MDQAQQQNPPQQEDGLFNQITSFLSRLMLFYFIYNMFFASKSTAPTTTPTGQVIPPHTCLFNASQEMVIYFQFIFSIYMFIYLQI